VSGLSCNHEAVGLNISSWQSPRAAPNPKTGKEEHDPRSTWKESGESLTEEVKKANPAAKVKVPDAITQTDNSAKRLQNAQMRQKQMEVEEPEALRKMREEREAREKMEQEAKDAAAAADAKMRSATGNFVSGQDLREARMVDEYKKQQADAVAGGGARQEVGSGGGGGDIRQKLRAMQGSSSRMRADKQRLQQQSMKSGKGVEEVATDMIALLNGQVALQCCKCVASCSCVARVLLVCCSCVARVLLVCCSCVARVLLVCCLCVARGREPSALEPET
jgi:hypothetical protein